MYEYKFHSTFSTKSSTIYDEDEKAIGTISKKYYNPLQRILDIALLGRYIENYEIKNTDGRIVFQAKKVLKPLEIRQFYIDYYNGSQHSSVHLIDRDLIVTGEGKKITFDYNRETYELEQKLLDWAKIKKDSKVVAVWDSPFPRYKANFKLIDKEYENDILFLIGIFHTYFRIQT